MVEKGARNIILVSRSGNSRQNVKDLILELSEMGANVVAHRCDIGNRFDVDKMLTGASKTMPSVRGVVHGAMVLNVSEIKLPCSSSNMFRTFFSKR